jgi:hypothetical protein
VRLATCLHCVGAVATFLCAPCLSGQPSARQRAERRVLLVPRAFADTLARRIVRAVVETAVQTRSTLLLVSLKDIDATMEQAVIFPAEWQPGDLRAICKLVNASRYVAVAVSAGATDSVRLVVGGAGCGAPPLDSLDLLRSLRPPETLRQLIALLNRQPQ